MAAGLNLLCTFDNADVAASLSLTEMMSKVRISTKETVKTFGISHAPNAETLQELPSQPLSDMSAIKRERATILRSPPFVDSQLSQALNHFCKYNIFIWQNKIFRLILRNT